MHQRGLHVLAYVSDQVKAKRKTAVARGWGLRWEAGALSKKVFW